MKRFVAGLACGGVFGAAAFLVAAVIVGLRVRVMDDEAPEQPDHH